MSSAKCRVSSVTSMTCTHHPARGRRWQRGRARSRLRQRQWRAFWTVFEHKKSKREKRKKERKRQEGDDNNNGKTECGGTDSSCVLRLRVRVRVWVPCPFVHSRPFALVVVLLFFRAAHTLISHLGHPRHAAAYTVSYRMILCIPCIPSKSLSDAVVRSSDLQISSNLVYPL